MTTAYMAQDGAGGSYLAPDNSGTTGSTVTPATTAVTGVGASPAVGTIQAVGGTGLATQVKIRAVDSSGNPRVSITGINWAFFDAHTLDQIRAPSAQGSGASTDASGNLTLNINGTTLTSGQYGYLAFSDGNGTLAQAATAKMFFGLVAVQ